MKRIICIMICAVTLEAFNGYAFPADKANLTAKINGKAVEVFNSTSTTEAYLRYYFEVKSPETITDKIDITVDEPVADEVVDMTLELSSDKVYCGAVEWYMYGNASAVANNHICGEGVEYFVCIELYAADGYTFGDTSDDAWRDELLSNITFNGEAILSCLSSSPERLIVVSPVYTAASKPKGILGDVNNDGDIDQYDYILAKRIHFKNYTPTEDQKTRGDVNKDGENDQYDYILIKRHHFGNFKIGG